MKPATHSPIALSVALALGALHACRGPEPPAPPEPAGSITALVTALPHSVEVTFRGKKVGPTPLEMAVASLDQLIDNFSTADPVTDPVEQRINVVSSSRAEVSLLFDRALSKMALALNMSSIIVFDYGEGITFDFNSSDLKPDFLSLLEKQAELLKSGFSEVDVYICGHTDSVGRAERNLELSLERAKAVYDRLVELGVPGSSMNVQGFASNYPLVSNATEAGRARNRRIEIILGR